MRNAITCGVALSCVLLAGCVLPHLDLQTSYHGYAQGPTGFVPIDITAGMSTSDAVRLLGAPETSAQGWQYMHYLRHFRGIQAGAQTGEFSWTRGDIVLVAYHEYGIVRALGEVPISALR